MYEAIHWAKHSTSGAQSRADGSRLINFYAVKPASPDTDAKTPVLLYGTPGMTEYLQLPDASVPAGLSDEPVNSVYGLIGIESPVYGNYLVGVLGEFQLFWKKIPDDYDHTESVLTVGASEVAFFTSESQRKATGPVKLATDGRYVVAVTKSTVYALDLRYLEATAQERIDEGLTGPFVTITAPTPDDDTVGDDLPDEDWVDCDWVDGYFILIARNGQIFNSLLDSVNFDQLEFNYANVKPDGATALATFSRMLYIIGDYSIEAWRNYAGQTFAFKRVYEWSIEYGCKSPDSVEVTDVGIFFLSSNGMVYFLSGESQLRLSGESVELDISNSNLDTARAYTYIEEGHRFYSLTLDMNDGSTKTWVLDITTKFWHERTVQDITEMVKFRNQNICARTGHNKLYLQSLNEGLVDGEEVLREAWGPVQHARQNRAVVQNLQLDIPPHPVNDEEWIKLFYTDDGGRTKVQVGDTAGKKLSSPRLKWNQLGQINRGRNFGIQMRTAQRTEVLGAYAEFEVGVD